MSLAKILVIEDDPTIAIDIRFNLEDYGYEVVDVLHRAESVLPILDKRKVDLVLLDINLEGEMTGIDLAKILYRDYQIPFIFLTSYSDENTLDEASSTFPAGYIVKPFKENDLAPSIKMALARHRSRLQFPFPSLDKINKKIVGQITSSEYKIIEEIWKGNSNKEIAEGLNISINTLKTHVRNIYSKLDLHRKPELISWLRTN